MAEINNLKKDAENFSKTSKKNQEEFMNKNLKLTKENKENEKSISKLNDKSKEDKDIIDKLNED